ncbi:MAG: hypothetical protein OEN02_07310 [Gammaproteobacteria bacterium]|nr:hypothetical protein [Gammaproteobacteria bacterium]MDH3535729.1 hypothetical protein [Gammaproteobacteria bacterium]
MSTLGRSIICSFILLFSYTPVQAVSTFGTFARGGDLEPISSFQEDGGEGASFASVSFSTYRAEAMFDPLSTYLPILRAQSTGIDATFDDDRTNAYAASYQTFSSAIAQTIFLDIELTSSVVNQSSAGTSSVLSNIYVIGGPGFMINDGFCSPGQFTFDGIYLCGSRTAEGLPRGTPPNEFNLNFSNLFNGGSNPLLQDTLEFSVGAGESFGIFAELSAGSFMGTADAFNTLGLTFDEDLTQSIGDISPLTIPSVSEVPLPGAVWLFVTALLGLLGLQRRNIKM